MVFKIYEGETTKNMFNDNYVSYGSNIFHGWFFKIVCDIVLTTFLISCVVILYTSKRSHATVNEPYLT